MVDVGLMLKLGGFETREKAVFDRSSTESSDIKSKLSAPADRMGQILVDEGWKGGHKWLFAREMMSTIIWWLRSVKNAFVEETSPDFEF